MICRSSAIVTYGGIILVSTLGVAYLRGWKFSDFLYVTRAGMQKSMASINSSESPTLYLPLLETHYTRTLHKS